MRDADDAELDAPLPRGARARPPVALRGLRLHAARGDGARLPRARERHPGAARGLRRRARCSCRSTTSGLGGRARAAAADEALRDDLRARGAETVARYSWDETARALCRLFRRVGGARGSALRVLLVNAHGADPDRRRRGALRRATSRAARARAGTRSCVLAAFPARVEPLDVEPSGCTGRDWREPTARAASATASATSSPRAAAALERARRRAAAPDARAHAQPAGVRHRRLGRRRAARASPSCTRSTTTTCSARASTLSAPDGSAVQRRTRSSAGCARRGSRAGPVAVSAVVARLRAPARPAPRRSSRRRARTSIRHPARCRRHDGLPAPPAARAGDARVPRRARRRSKGIDRLLAAAPTSRAGCGCGSPATGGCAPRSRRPRAATSSTRAGRGRGEAAFLAGCDAGLVPSVWDEPGGAAVRRLSSGSRPAGPCSSSDRGGLGRGGRRSPAASPYRADRRRASSAPVRAARRAGAWRGCGRRRSAPVGRRRTTSSAGSTSTSASTTARGRVIDTHCHLLPGLDDGPRDLGEAVALAGGSSADGVETVVCTPHFSRQFPTEHARQPRATATSCGASSRDAGIALALELAAEVAPRDRCSRRRSTSSARRAIGRALRPRRAAPGHAGGLLRRRRRDGSRGRPRAGVRAPRALPRRPRPTASCSTRLADAGALVQVVAPSLDRALGREPPRPLRGSSSRPGASTCSRATRTGRPPPRLPPRRGPGAGEVAARRGPHVAATLTVDAPARLLGEELRPVTLRIADRSRPQLADAGADDPRASGR